MTNISDINININDTKIGHPAIDHAQFITTALQYNNQIIWDVWQVQVSLLPQGWWRGLKGDVVNIGDGDVVGL